MLLKTLRSMSAACLVGGALLLTTTGFAFADDAITKSVTTDPALHAMLPKEIRDAGVITLATDAHYPPCESFADDNVTMIGWEPDFWDALGKKLGVRVKPGSLDFDNLIPSIQSGRSDIAMECISDSLEREKQVLFVDVSISTNGVYALGNSPITSDPLSLCGLKSGSQTGTTFGASVDTVLSPLCVKNGKPAITKVEFPSEDATLLARLSGRVDFLVNDASSAAELKKKSQKPIKLVTLSVLPKWFDGIIMKPQRTDLAKALLAGTQAIIADGTYDRIMNKWQLDAVKLETPGINLVSHGAVAR